jgi:hypothetical protein
LDSFRIDLVTIEDTFLKSVIARGRVGRRSGLRKSRLALGRLSLVAVFTIRAAAVPARLSQLDALIAIVTAETGAIPCIYWITGHVGE